jgi:hypothetical protein
MFASLRNSFFLLSNMIALLRFALISIPLKGHGNEADFLICYLVLIFSDFAADPGLINYIESVMLVLVKGNTKRTIRV